MLHATHTNNVSGISCNLVYLHFSHDQIGWILVKNFSKIFGSNSRIMLSLRIVSDISLVLFFKISDGDMQVERLLTFSWWMSSIFEIDQAFDTNGKLIANDHDFQVDISSLTQDLAPYFGKNIIHTSNLKIDQMVNQDRVIAPNNHERVLFSVTRLLYLGLRIGKKYTSYMIKRWLAYCSSTESSKTL